MQYIVYTAANDPMEFHSNSLAKALAYMKDPFKTGTETTEFFTHIVVEDNKVIFTMVPETKVRKKAVKMAAPLPETPKLGVHCHIVSCKETTNVRGFFCCGNHGCDHS